MTAFDTAAARREVGPVFREEFLGLPAERIQHDLQEQGFSVHEGVLRRQQITILEQQLSRPIEYNVNDVTPVQYAHQEYFTHALAASRAYFDVVTHPRFRSIARAALGAAFRLKCQRYYKSGRGHALPWHRDAKTPDGDYTGVRGLAVVVYLTDTTEGELQVLPGSHRWPLSQRPSDASDGEDAAGHDDAVVTLSLRAGSVIVFDTHLLHRTRPIALAGYERRSIFFQLDADLRNAEHLLLNPAWLDREDDELLRYLGVGLPTTYQAMPPSTLQTLSDRRVARMAYDAVRELARRSPARVRSGLRALKNRLVP